MSEEDIRLPAEEAVEQPIVAEDTAPQETQKPIKLKRQRRGRIRYAAPLGFLVLFFATIGVISVLVGGIKWIIKSQDDSALREELYVFLDPVMELGPSEFDSVETAEDADSLLLSAVYRVSKKERIRQLREKDETCAYPVEETLYRMIVPQTTIEESYRFLFGDASVTHRTIGDVEYNAQNACYYVPMSFNTSGYTPVIGSIRKKGSTYTVRVAYVANTDIQVDERGNAIPPTTKQATYSQRYTVKKTAEGWKLLSVSGI